METSNLKYLLAFITPDFKDAIFLADRADIKSICYSDTPQLLGTKNPKYAKLYDSMDSAKSDLYLLRYHHRCFLGIKNMIISIDIKDLRPEASADCSSFYIENYNPDMFLEAEKTNENIED